MSITDELRKYVTSMCGYPHSAKCSGYNKLLEIADRIDERHEEIIYEYRREYEDFKSYRDIAYVELPVDADRVPIHIGDKVSEPDYKPEGGVVVGMKLYKGWDHWLINCGAWVDPRKCHHVKPDSWEHIIKDAVKLGYADYPTTSYEAELVERCKRLAGE